MSQMQGNALEISLDFQFGPIPAIFSAHAPAHDEICSFIPPLLITGAGKYTPLNFTHSFRLRSITLICTQDSP